MPNLQQMYAAVNAKTAYSRPNEIYGALDKGGRRVYNAVLKEMAGFFLKFDTTSIVLTPGQQEYILPADLTSLVNIAERLTSTENWHSLEPCPHAELFFNHCMAKAKALGTTRVKGSDTSFCSATGTADPLRVRRKAAGQPGGMMRLRDPCPEQEP